MNQLQRITTQYIDTEDRVRLAGEDEEGAPRILWLSQRLMNRLVRVLCEWLEKQTKTTVAAEAIQGFEQQAARAELAPLPEVSAGGETATWLVQSVDIARTDAQVQLRLVGAAGEAASMVLNTTQMRQWLSILHDQYCKGEWSLDVWPVWMAEGE